MGIARSIIGSLLALALCVSVKAQVWSYGHDRNSSPLYVAGDPPPKPKIGSIITIEFYLDGLWAEEVWGALYFGIAMEMEANICFHSTSTHPDHHINRWLLIPPLFLASMMRWTPHSTGVFRYHLLIPDDPTLIGEAVTAQAFMQATDQHGGSKCDRFRATTALRIQFMPISL